MASSSSSTEDDSPQASAGQQQPRGEEEDLGGLCEVFEEDIVVGTSSDGQAKAETAGVAASKPPKRLFPLPIIRTESKWVQRGLRLCGNRRTNYYLHLIWGSLYAVAGLTQLAAGIYFMLHLPIFQLGSNIWTGAWNIFSAVVTIVLCCQGPLTVLKAQGLLLMSLVVIVVNLINLVILEVGEWRGFLSQSDQKYIQAGGMEDMMYQAYLCTTISTIGAMISSFFASQQTFCFLQVQAEQEGTSSKPIHAHNGVFGRSIDADSLMTKDLIKRTSESSDSSGSSDQLNLKTPAAPAPHPSWVYRNNYAPFNPNRSPVKRSLSLLGASKGAAGGKGVTTGQFDQQRFEMLSKSAANAMRKIGLSGISESSFEPAAPPPPPPPPKQQRPMQMRHAVIRRHQSMYIHPRTTTDIGSGGPGMKLLPGSSQTLQPYKMHEVSGKSEVRPIVTLQRSKTTVGAINGSVHYRSTPIQGLHRNTFNQNGKYSRQANGNKPMDNLVDYNHNNLQYNRTGGLPTNVFSNTEELCEFQAGRSFDLPDPEKYRRRYQNLHQQQQQQHQKQKSHSNDASCVVFEPETESDIIAGMLDNGSRTPKHIRALMDDLSLDSCHGNIRYQAVEGLVQNSRPNAAVNPGMSEQDDITVFRDKDGMNGSHYSSLENLLQSSESSLAQKHHHPLRHRSHYGSTESLSSLGSAKNSPTTHSRNLSTQTPSISLYSASSHRDLTAGRSRESPYTVDTPADPEDESLRRNRRVTYDVPRPRATVQKSNSRVASVGRLRLHVESFRQTKNSSGTQTELTVMRSGSSADADSKMAAGAKYTAQFKKHITPPNKPARKTKPAPSPSGPNPAGQRRSSSASNHPDVSSGRSDRSASPDNSSTSGYSSPSAGIHSKEASPYGSKIDDTGSGGEKRSSESSSLEDAAADENSSKITVIQIVPASLRSSFADETSSRPSLEAGMASCDSLEEDDIMASAVEENLHRRSLAAPLPATSSSHYARMSQNATPVASHHHHRELPRIATNGTFARSAQVKRKLPDPASATSSLTPERQELLQKGVFQFQRGEMHHSHQDPYDHDPPQHHQHHPQHQQHQQQPVQYPSKQFYRPNRATGMTPFAQGRVPLPPVPELERSDHERESISPTLESPAQKVSPSSSAPAADSILKAPVPRARRQPPPPGPSTSTSTSSRPLTQRQSLSRLHHDSKHEVDERLRALLQLLKTSPSASGGLMTRAGGGATSSGESLYDSSTGSSSTDLMQGIPKEDTLQYLSQLENVARRLKDKLMSEEPKVHEYVHSSSSSSEDRRRHNRSPSAVLEGTHLQSESNC